MNYPNNRLIVNGVDLTEQFKMILADGYTLTPPSPKTYTVDIPGGHGKLDLTESLFGDVVYENRKQEFTFYLIDVENFEQVKTEVSRMLHGKYFEYKMTMDPEYTYKGRFSVSSYSHSTFSSGNLGQIKITIDADPFKYKKDEIVPISCVGGKIFTFKSGRKRVIPTIQTSGLLKVIFNNKLIKLPEGTWTINDLAFNSGDNQVYFNSFDVRVIRWKDLKTKPVLWKEFKQQRLFEWYRSDGTGTIVFTTWDKVKDKTWNDYKASGESWADIIYMFEQVKDVEDSYIKYEWGDL